MHQTQTASSPLEDLAHRWEDLWDLMCLEPRTGLFETLISRWTEPHRHLLRPEHLLVCLEALDLLDPYLDDRYEVEFALWYRGAIFQPRRQDNEERSAELAASTFVKSGGKPAIAERIRDLVLLTTHRAPVLSVDAAVMMDADLAYLGMPEALYDRAEQQIRLDHQHMTDAHYNPVRKRTLEALLARASIFRTPVMRDRLEAQARSNVARALSFLPSI